MTDHEAITALILEYATAVDRGDFDAVGALFEKGVLHSPRGEARGRVAVTDWYRSVKLDDDGSPGTWHHVFGIEIDLDGDVATARSYITVIQDRRPIITASYDDTFARDVDGWRFERRRVSMDLLGDISRHVDLRA